MKCGIMTFYFAHNYGAMLQAYALKQYLVSMGHETLIIPYVPSKMKKTYSLNPFAKGFNMKYILRQMLRFPKRIGQYRLFDEFKESFLLNASELSTDTTTYDIVFFGSDQIWNEKITGDITNYYGTLFDESVKKVAYAASFGRSELTQFQKECVEKYLPYFQFIALREPDSVDFVQKYVNNVVSCVLDPVFLLNREHWCDLAVKSIKRVSGKYLLYYVLHNDEDLIQYAKELSKETGYKIVCVHPTLGLKIKGEKQLSDIGPIEFVCMIKNAEMVITNSFHATAFSLILSKELIYKTFSDTDTRVSSLLERCGRKIQTGINRLIFSEKDYLLLDLERNNSKQFIYDALNAN